MADLKHQPHGAIQGNSLIAGQGEDLGRTEQAHWSVAVTKRGATEGGGTRGRNEPVCLGSPCLPVCLANTGIPLKPQPPLYGPFCVSYPTEKPVFEVGSCYSAQAGLELMVLLLCSSQYWEESFS